MTEALGVTPRELLEEWEIKKSGWRLQTALKSAKSETKSGPHHLQSLGYLAAHFVQE